MIESLRRTTWSGVSLSPGRLGYTDTHVQAKITARQLHTIFTTERSHSAYVSPEGEGAG